MSEQNQTNVPATANNGVAVAQQAKTKKVDVLKGILNADSVQEQFRNALGQNSGTFVASVIDLYNSDTKLQLCEPKAVVMEALKAAVLHLPINKALGYAYIIPFNNTKKIHDEKGREQLVKVMEPTFQLGYKGYIQLAMRTGQYRTLNADVVYEGELRKVDKLTGEIAFDGKKVSDKVVGYFCYFELSNHYCKTLYMTVEQMAQHAKKYSKGLSRDTTIEQLLAQAAMPVQTDSKSVGWLGNFHSMGIKTVVRNLLSKWGYLSVEMQQAFTDDIRGEDYSDSRDVQPQRIVLDQENAQVVGDAQTSLPAPPQNVPDPGY